MCVSQFDGLTTSAGLLKVETVGPVYVVRANTSHVFNGRLPQLACLSGAHGMHAIPLYPRMQVWEWFHSNSRNKGGGGGGTAPTGAFFSACCGCLLF